MLENPGIFHRGLVLNPLWDTQQFCSFALVTFSRQRSLAACGRTINESFFKEQAASSSGKTMTLPALELCIFWGQVDKNIKSVQESHFQIVTPTFLEHCVLCPHVCPTLCREMICFDWWTVKVKRGWNGKPLLCSFYVLTHKHNSNYIHYTIHTIPRHFRLYKVF